MAEAAVLEQASAITETAPSAASEPVDLSAQPLDAELERSAAVAEKYFADAQAAETAVERPRGPDGKFVSAKAAEATAPPTIEVTPPAEVGESPPVPATPKIDWVLAEAARLEGFTPEQIAGFKDEQDVQHNIAVRRYGALQRAGISPEEFNAYRQWQQQQSQQHVQQRQQPLTGQQQQQPPPSKGAPPPAAQSPEAFKLQLDETELAPELIKPLRDMESFANKVLAENQQLRQQMARVETTVEQRVQAVQQAAQQAANEARTASEWDSAAKETPGFVEVMGLPSEAKKLSMTNPDDPKVQNYMAYAAYFKPIYERAVAHLGPDNVALPRVMADAFAASPFARLVGTNVKNNGTSATVGHGSVVRSAPRRGPAAEPNPQGDDLAAEMQRVTEVAGQAWERMGTNPFAAGWRS